MAKLVKVADTKDLTPGKADAYDVEGNRIAVFNVGGAFYAIDNTCTHAGVPLCHGYVEDCKVTCPAHEAVFDLKTGAALAPPAFEDVKTYKVVIEGSDIKIEL